MNYGLFKYELEVRDNRSLDGASSDGVIATGVHAIVYDAGTKTKGTIYADERKTAKTNDITRTAYALDGKILFWSPKTSVDIAIFDDKGNNCVYTAVTPVKHVLPLDRGNPFKCMVFPMIFNAGATEIDTGLDLPYGALVTDAAVEVVTTDAGETVDVGLLSGGTAGDADGFLAAVSVASAGVPARHTYTAGGNETYLSAVTFGVLLASRSLGTDVATDVGSLARLQHYVTGSNETSITYTPSTSDTFAGYGFVWYTALR
jgi:hypothetical protein